MKSANYSNIKIYKIVFYVIFFLLFLSCIYIWFIQNTSNTPNNEQPILSVQLHYNLNYLDYSIIHLKNLKLTYYTNTIQETDETPNITASNRIVAEGYVALSRDLISKYNVKWGDLFCMQDKCFVIEDTMNLKNKKSVDIFIYTRDKKKLNRSDKVDGKLVLFRRNP